MQFGTSGLSAGNALWHDPAKKIVIKRRRARSAAGHVHASLSMEYSRRQPHASVLRTKSCAPRTAVVYWVCLIAPVFFAIIVRTQRCASSCQRQTSSSVQPARSQSCGSRCQSPRALAMETSSMARGSFGTPANASRQSCETGIWSMICAIGRSRIASNSENKPVRKNPWRASPDARRRPRRSEHGPAPFGSTRRNADPPG